MRGLKVELKWRRRLVRAVFALGLLGLLVWFVLPFAVSLPVKLREVPEASPVLLDRHGTPILHLTLPDSTRSRPVTADEIPRDLIACTLAAEDKRFYGHGGVDPLATLRAGRDLLAKRRIVSGASTITQQLIKITSPPAARSPMTKIREALAARRLEMTWSKQQILTAYLNHLDYGNLRIGAAEAARFYFQKPLADLSLGECALLAGLPQSPSRLNPVRHPQRAIVRRNTVLKRLAATGEHDAARISAALAEPLSLRPLVESKSAPWLSQISNPKSEIQTTLDLPLQRDLEAIVREETARLKDANLRHAAVVVIHNPTGEILALVSSADWDDPRGGQFNGALAPRSPGSTLKPFTYLLAMERNHRIPSSILADIPTPFRTPQGLDLPENYDRTYRGPVTLRTALACSLNVPALRELNFLGGPEPLHEIARKPRHHHPRQRIPPSTASDSRSETPRSACSNSPTPTPPSPAKALTFPRCSSLRTSDVGRSMFDVRSAWLIADILADSTARAPSFQPGGPLDLPFRCAVKTGTSSDFRDNWCIGFTPEFTVGVWAGNFEQQPMKGISGIAGAGPIFHRAMLRLPPRRQAHLVRATARDRSEITIDPRNGKLVAADAKNAVRDLTPADQLPPAATAADYDADGRALLDPTFAEWFASRHNVRRRRPGDELRRARPRSTPHHQPGGQFHLSARSGNPLRLRQAPPGHQPPRHRPLAVRNLAHRAGQPGADHPPHRRHPRRHRHGSGDAESPTR